MYNGVPPIRIIKNGAGVRDNCKVSNFTLNKAFIFSFFEEMSSHRYKLINIFRICHNIHTSELAKQPHFFAFFYLTKEAKFF